MDNIVERINECKDRAERFLLSLQLEDGVFDTSHYNNSKETGMLLAGTYDAVSALGLIKRLDSINKEKAKDFILSHRNSQGYYKIQEMRKKDLTYKDFEYDDFHVTNYSISALGYLSYPLSKKDLRFLKNYNSKRRLKKWLNQRDMEKPWMEGNFVVNLASFFLLGRTLGLQPCEKRMEELIAWHRENQDEFGYYHDPDIGDLTNAFAGATHNYHIFYHDNLPIARYKTIIDYLLTRSTDIETACIDVDEVDVLCNFIKYGYRGDEIRAWLTKKLDSLLQFQNADGGFADQIDGVRTFDGWTKYKEPQGIPNAFATWFRLIAIGMIAVTAYGDSDNWQFRNTIGIGYFNKDYLNNGFDPEKMREAERAVLQRAEKRKANKTADVAGSLNDDAVSDLVALFQKRVETVEKSKLTFEASFSVNIISEGSFHLVIKDGDAKVDNGALQDANLTVTCKRDVLTKIVEGKMDAKLAYATGKLKCKGDIAYAFKLTVLM